MLTFVHNQKTRYARSKTQTEEATRPTFLRLVPPEQMEFKLGAHDFDRRMENTRLEIQRLETKLIQDRFYGESEIELIKYRLRMLDQETVSPVLHFPKRQSYWVRQGRLDTLDAEEKAEAIKLSREFKQDHRNISRWRHKRNLGRKPRRCKPWQHLSHRMGHI